MYTALFMLLFSSSNGQFLLYLIKDCLSMLISCNCSLSEILLAVFCVDLILQFVTIFARFELKQFVSLKQS